MCENPIYRRKGFKSLRVNPIYRRKGFNPIYRRKGFNPIYRRKGFESLRVGCVTFKNFLRASGLAEGFGAIKKSIALAPMLFNNVQNVNKIFSQN